MRPAPRLCTCRRPARQVVEGLELCAECGERIPAAESLLILAELRDLRRALGLAPRAGWLTPKELAAKLGVDVSWVYRHTDELGAERLGDGPRPRLRFRAELAERADPLRRD